LQEERESGESVEIFFFPTTGLEERGKIGGQR
jgi:hypothetical protein